MCEATVQGHVVIFYPEAPLAIRCWILAAMSPSNEPYVLPPVYGTSGTEQQLLDGSIWDNRFGSLDQGGKIAAE